MVTNINTAPRGHIKHEKVYKDLPPWLINNKSNICLDGWLHWEVHGIGRIDKVIKYHYRFQVSLASLNDNFAAQNNFAYTRSFAKGIIRGLFLYLLLSCIHPLSCQIGVCIYVFTRWIQGKSQIGYIFYPSEIIVNVTTIIFL